MKIEISGNRCVGCGKYSQYYHLNHEGVFEPIDKGFCGNRQCIVRPGDRCRRYVERGNTGMPARPALQMSPDGGAR